MNNFSLNARKDSFRLCILPVPGCVYQTVCLMVLGGVFIVFSPLIWVDLENSTGNINVGFLLKKTLNTPLIELGLKLYIYFFPEKWE